MQRRVHSASQASTPQAALALALCALDAHQEAQMTIPTRQHHAWHVWLGLLRQRVTPECVRPAWRVNTPPHQPRCARVVLPAPWTTTLSPIRRALGVWQASTRRLGTQVLAMLAAPGASGLQMVAPTKQYVRCVGWVSTPRKGQAPACSAPLVQPMRTAIHRHPALIVTRASTLDAVRHRATSALPVRWTATSIPQRHALNVRWASTGRPAPL
jgi:hypothetical protein